MAVLEIKNCYHFYEVLLFHDKAWLPIETVVVLEATIEHLKELEKIKEREALK